METLEIRWFFDNQPDSFHQWNGEFQERTDWYAPVADSRSSIKLRESQIEAKFLLETVTAPVSELPIRELQRWSKVGVPLPADECAQWQELGNRGWLGVNKRRIVRFYDVQHHRIARGANPALPAVQVEWGTIRMNGRDAWTFCLEASGGAGADAVIGVAENVSRELSLEVSGFPDPQSYPEWIAVQLTKPAVSGVSESPAPSPASSFYCGP